MRTAPAQDEAQEKTDLCFSIYVDSCSVVYLSHFSSVRKCLNTLPLFLSGVSGTILYPINRYDYCAIIVLIFQILGKLTNLWLETNKAGFQAQQSSYRAYPNTHGSLYNQLYPTVSERLWQMPLCLSVHWPCNSVGCKPYNPAWLRMRRPQKFSMKPPSLPNTACPVQNWAIQKPRCFSFSSTSRALKCSESDLMDMN